MKYGNCLLCALWICATNLIKGELCYITFRKSSQDIGPHFFVVGRQKVWDFQLDEDFLCWPFYYLLFKGHCRTRSLQAWERTSRWHDNIDRT